MTENPEFDFDKHPLWPLSRLITRELLRCLKRLEAGNYTDDNEMQFQVFLQDEARERVTRSIIPDIDESWNKLYITDLQKRKDYEKDWNKLLLAASIKHMSEQKMLVELDSLYETWKNSPKDVLHFSQN